VPFQSGAIPFPASYKTGSRSSAVTFAARARQ
jgi:hypothetical protein